MTRRVGVLAVLLLAVTAPACASTGGQSDAASAAHRPQIKHITVEYAKSYDSIFVLLADTKVAVIATAKSVALDPTTRRSSPDSLVTMDVDKVLLGKPGVRITVYEAGGQPGEVVQGQVPIRVGHSYLMLLGVGPRLGQYFVLHGITGLFSYDSKTQVATRLDRSATWIPRTVDLSLAESILGTPIASSPAPKPLAPLAGACPPGCSLPSDYDAITVLASSSTVVAIVTVTDKKGSAVPSVATTDTMPSFLTTTDSILQGNPHHLIYAPTGAALRHLRYYSIPSNGVENGPATPDLVGKSFIVFMSYNRGGSCVSALFSYDPTSQVATLIGSQDGMRNQIVLPGRVLPIPETVSLSNIRARMYPTTGVVYPSDSEEWYCPGP